MCIVACRLHSLHTHQRPASLITRHPSHHPSPITHTDYPPCSPITHHASPIHTLTAHPSACSPISAQHHPSPITHLPSCITHTDYPHCSPISMLTHQRPASLITHHPHRLPSLLTQQRPASALVQNSFQLAADPDQRLHLLCKPCMTTSCNALLNEPQPARSLLCCPSFILSCPVSCVWGSWSSAQTCCSLTGGWPPHFRCCYALHRRPSTWMHTSGLFE